MKIKSETVDSLFVYQNPSEISASHSSGRILDCAYAICWYDQI